VSREALAIFPLSNVVLFPGVQAPLHLFEERYRQMAAQVLASDRCIGMVVVPPEHAHAMPGDPPVYPVGCSGLIAHAKELPDGRYNIVLAGTHRFRILSEPPRPEDRLYRTAEVERLEDPFPEAERERVAELRGRIIELVHHLVRRADPRRAARISPELFRGVDDVTFVNSLCNSLGFATPDKQGLLEADSLLVRVERLEGLLSFRLAGFARPGAAGPQTLH
jgi:Lon protease-like protein